ncbi:MAG: phosphopantetheine-binding protein [Actinomycetota bacterium]|nr:phosphopantetheine-binding protein [Actinomycetota bacterium]
MSAVRSHQVLATVRRYLLREDITLDDDFLAIGGDTTLATALADELSRTLGSPVSRYDLLFSPRMDDWPEIISARS